MKYGFLAVAALALGAAITETTSNRFDAFVVLCVVGMLGAAAMHVFDGYKCIR